MCQNFQPIILHGEILTYHPKVFRICIIYFYFQKVIIIFFFNTTVSDVCKSLRVQLKNNALETQGDREGTYELASKANEQPSWISEGSGIWYLPDATRWIIGPLDYIGTDFGGIESKEFGSKVEYPENIVHWNYAIAIDDWVFYNGNDDVIVGCVSHSKDHKKKDKYNF